MPARKFLWNVTWIFLLPFLRIFCRFRIEGQKNIKNLKKPVILAIATHSNLLDAYIVGAAMPFNCHLFPIRYMTKAGFFRMPIVKQIIRAYGAFPVRRDVGLENSLEMANELIQKGETVGIFIEGKIFKYGELREFKPGAAALSIQTAAPIIPVALKGTHQIRNPLKFLFKKRISVSFGKTIPVPPDITNDKQTITKEKVNALTQTINNEIKNLYSSC